MHLLNHRKQWIAHSSWLLFAGKTIKWQVNCYDNGEFKVCIAYFITSDIQTFQNSKLESNVMQMF